MDARAQRGRWLLRVEDVDATRVVPGAAADILRTLEAFGFEWDGAVVQQSDRRQFYESALTSLREHGLTFECSCSRTQLADEERYPGYCRNAPRVPGVATATRLRAEPGAVQFTDRVQGTFRQDVAAAVGDFVLRRRDALAAYVLAVVVDDAAQGVTHIVRGADLLDNTPRQIYLQRLLGATQPEYAHLPLLLEPDGRKLAKSARSISVRRAAPAIVPQLLRILRLLGMEPPAGLAQGVAAEVWVWAASNWRIDAVPRRLTQVLER